MPRQFQRTAEWIASVELPIVAAIALVLLFSPPTGLVALAVVPFLWCCVWCTTGRVIPRTPLNATLWLLLAMVAAGVLATLDVRSSLGKTSDVVLGVVLFWAVTRWITTRERLSTAVAAFLLIGGALAIIGLPAIVDRSPMLDAIVSSLPGSVRRVFGAEEGFQPNAVAGCLVLFIPLQVALAGREFRRVVSRRSAIGGSARRTLVHALLLMLTAGTLLLTQSREAWVGMVVAALAFMAWHARWTRAVAGTVIVAGVVSASMVSQSRFFDFVIGPSGQGTVGIVSGRTELWSRALHVIQDFPFAGVGGNVLSPANLDVAHVHNQLLQTALDLGLPGLIAYLSMWMMVAVLLVAVYRQSAEPFARDVSSGLGAGLIAHFVFSMTDAIPLGAKVSVFFWLTLALATAFHRVAARQLGPGPGKA